MTATQTDKCDALRVFGPDINTGAGPVPPGVGAEGMVPVPQMRLCFSESSPAAKPVRTAPPLTGPSPMSTSCGITASFLAQGFSG